MTISLPESVRQALARAEHRPCPLCGGEQAEPLWFRGLHASAAVAATMVPRAEAGWWIVCCTACGLARVDPMPLANDLPGLYDETYFTAGVFDGALHAGGMGGHLTLYDGPGRRQASLRWHGRRLAHLSRFLANTAVAAPAALPRSAGSTATIQAHGRLLDVGCGAGYFLDAAREAGWRVTGVEFSPAAARVGREGLGLDIRQGTLAEAAFPPARFDVVTMFEVLEHMRDPAATLNEVQRILKPGGLLAVQVPNDLVSYRNQVFGRSNLWWIIPPLHLFYFSIATLAHLLEKNGFWPIYLGTTGSLGSDALTLLRARGRRPGRWLTAALRRLPTPLDWLAARSGRHTELLVYARRLA